MKLSTTTIISFAKQLQTTSLKKSLNWIFFGKLQVKRYETIETRRCRRNTYGINKGTNSFLPVGEGACSNKMTPFAFVNRYRMGCEVVKEMV